MRIFAGVAPWEWINKEHRKIECEKLIKGKIAYGDLVETGLFEDEKFQKSDEGV